MDIEYTPTEVYVWEIGNVILDWVFPSPQFTLNEEMQLELELFPTVIENISYDEVPKQLLNGSEKRLFGSLKLISGFCFTVTVFVFVTVQPALVTVKVTVKGALPHPNETKECVGFCWDDNADESPKFQE